MSIINPKATRDIAKSTHPDIDPGTGDLRPEAFLWSDPTERDENRRFAEDRVWAGQFMDDVARRQAALPAAMQWEIGGQVFGEGRGFYAGYREYQAKLAELQAEEDKYTYPGASVVLRPDQVEAMSLAEYDQYFDDRGQSRPGVVFEHGSRSVRLNDQIDQWSAGELRSNHG